MLHRRTVLKGLAAASTALLPLPAIGQRTSARTLKVIRGSNLASLDPIWTTSPVTNDYGMLVYDMLIGLGNDYQPKPQMVEGWQLEDGGRTYIFKLRTGLKFHDGEPVRSADCIASIKRWSTRDSTGQLVAAATDRMEVVDDRTFRIRLKKPMALLPDALGKANSSQCFIMPERVAVTDPTKQIGEVIGSGPYRFLKDEFVTGQRAAYARFEGYVPRNEAPDGCAGGKLIKLDRMEWTFISDAATALGSLQTGEHDYWDSPLPDLLPVIRGDANLAAAARTKAGIYYSFVMNHLQPPFNNPAIRQAVAIAIDQRQYMIAASGNDPDNSGHCASYYMCDTPYASDAGGDILKQANMEKARAALKAAGYAGEKVVLLAPSDPPAVAAITQVTDDLLRRMGFNVQFVAMDFATMIQRRNNKESVDKGGWSVFNSTYGGLGLINPAVNILLRGAGPDGWFGWAENRELEKLRDQWLDATDPTEQMRLAHAIQLEGFKTLPYIPLGYAAQPHAWSRKLTGVDVAPANTYWNIGKNA